MSIKCHIKVIYNVPIYIFKFRVHKNRKKEEENILKIKQIPKRVFSISKREKRKLLNTNWLFSNTKKSSNKDILKLDISYLPKAKINTNNFSISNLIESDLNSPSLNNDDDDLFKNEEKNLIILIQKN